jgi:squalene/oxidosqualene cyclase-like protein
MNEPGTTATPEPGRLEPSTRERAIARGIDRLAALQEPDGHWAGDYGGPLFLLPGLVIARSFVGEPWSEHERARMITYLANVQREDGGWGLHVEGASTMLGTGLNYVAFRLLGVEASDPRAKKARQWILSHGGAVSIPTWGKAWLSVLGVYEWAGVAPLLPELWLLPRSLPMHPANFWCHTRAVFLPMSYLYGRRARGPVTETVRALRGELYLDPYERIDWRAARSNVNPLDAYSPHTRLLDGLNLVLRGYERFHSPILRQRALAFVLDQIHHEDESTGFLDIGPVSKALHLACVHFEDPEQPAVKKHLERVADYLWDGRDGMKMQGYNGSQFWDLAFTMQSIAEHRPNLDLPGARALLERAFGWLEKNQVRDDVPQRERYFRNATRGAFPFSTAEQAWPVTDCTAEGIKCALASKELGIGALAPRRLEEAVDVLLAEQNDDGGWSEYERARGPRWLERLNAAEVFGDIMIGYSHPECTSACIQGLVAFEKRSPSYRRDEVRRAIARGVEWLLRDQRPDGSFYGCWGVCFSYATWFGIDGLVAAGAAEEHADRIIAAADFLLARQRPDGGWGESYESSPEKRWIDHERSQPVQTAWALLGLATTLEHLSTRLGPGRRREVQEALRRGADYLVATQTDDGWPFDMVYGVFNRNCMINYDNYRYYFPLWALSRCERLASQIG